MEYVCDLLAIQFDLGEPPVPPQVWLDTDPGSGIIEPDNSVDVNLAFNAGSLPDGTYEGIFRLITNDPFNGISDIPLVMNVGQVGIDDNTEILPGRFALPKLAMYRLRHSTSSVRKSQQYTTASGMPANIRCYGMPKTCHPEHILSDFYVMTNQPKPR